MTNVDKVDQAISLIESGTAIIEPQNGLHKIFTESSKTGKPLRVKLGFDPTAPDLHLGHAVVARKLKQFQDLGHTVVVIIGDYTARRGDPSGRNDSRPPLSEEQSNQNAQTYLDQLGLVLDLDKIEIRRNSEWFKAKSFDEALDLAQNFKIGRLFERKDFGDRYEAQQSITLSELMYPGLQGQDSVEIKADIEIGGTDQLYNLLVGRDLQKDAGQKPQVVLCMPILPGTDGIIKMSKSKGNYIGLTETPNSMFQKVMALKDIVFDGDEEILVVKAYVELTVSNLTTRKRLLDTIASIENGDLDRSEYTQVKKEIAYDIVSSFHGIQAANMAKELSEKTQKLGLGSAKLLTVSYTKIPNESNFVDVCKALLAVAGVEPTGSNNPKRLISSGAVKIDGQQHLEPYSTAPLAKGAIIAIGKKLAFEVS